jgi:fructoselysine-6-P-deglycase FrlB-like protein
MSDFVGAEIASQPDVWRQAATLPGLPRVADVLPAAGQRVAVVGCGTSWFVAMAYAALRESAGAGWTDAFAASEFPAGRGYDVIVAISRSGTTTEVVDLLRSIGPGTRKLAIVAAADTPVAAAADDVIVLDFADERSVVQTRYATAALVLLRAHLGENIEPIAADAERALALDLPDSAVTAEQLTFLGRGWTVGLAQEAALKAREAAQSWAEAYPAMDYRHGPIAIAAPGRVVWAFGAMPPGLQGEVGATGAEWLAHDHLDPLAVLVLAQRVAVARAERGGLDPDQPRHLTRSVILEPQPGPQ